MRSERATAAASIYTSGENYLSLENLALDSDEPESPLLKDVLCNDWLKLTSAYEEVEF